MKNKKILLISSFIFIVLNIFNSVFAENLNIKAKNINIDKETKLIIFEGNVIAIDNNNNVLETEKAEYNKSEDTLIAKQKVKIRTSEGYEIISENIYFNNIKGIISSNRNSQITDIDGNIINVEMFEYNRNKNLLFSKGNIKIIDVKENIYKFSEIYIDEKKNKIIGSDLRAFFNPNSLGSNSKNDPRIFGNSISISEDKSEIGKGVFTYCQLKDEDDCPAWSLQANKITHDTAKKTIYYDKAVLKVYDIPIFYFPKFFHPDPTVKRKTGFLPPSFVDSKNLGTGTVLPYYIDIAPDRDLTITPKLYSKESPLMLAEYRRDYEKSFLILDAGFTEGYKDTSLKKKGGSKNHFFSNYNVDLYDDGKTFSNLELKVQKVSNDTYLKIYDVKTSLADKNTDVLETLINYNYETDEKSLNLSMGMFENITINDNSRYEYYFPNINYAQNLFNDDSIGSLDLNSNLIVRNYDINKQTEQLINDFNFNSLKWIDNIGFKNQLKSQIKLTNYTAKNTRHYKNDDLNTELHGVVGISSELPLIKKLKNGLDTHFFTPKALFRYAPGDMRKFSDNSKRLNPSNIFTLDRIGEIDTIETGLSTTLGFDYEVMKKNRITKDEKRNLLISAGQIINEKEDQDKPSPLNQRFSDVAGEAIWTPSENFKMSYNFNLDQNYKDLQYSEIGTDFNLGKINFNLNYLEEKEYIGTQEYLKTSMGYKVNDVSTLSFSTKRNLLRDSSEFYNLSYQYANDCFKAGVVFRREFYDDRDIEADTSLLFTISIIPFSNINSPKVR